jgi:hypothetical protein
MINAKYSSGYFAPNLQVVVFSAGTSPSTIEFWLKLGHMNGLICRKINLD